MIGLEIDKTIHFGGVLPLNNLCVAHRGYSSLAPENTAAAISGAMSFPYVQWVEVDVQCSIDGVPFLIHDYTLGRTTNGRGEVKDKTWAELQQLDAGSWKGKAYQNERLISFDQFLDFICGRLQANIEIKTHNNLYPGIEAKVIEAIKRRQMEHDVVLTSFDTDSLSRVKELDPYMRTGLIIDSNPNDLLLRLQLLKCSFLSINYRHIDPALVKSMRSAGITIMAWTIDDKKTMQRMRDLDADIMICTNEVGLWGEVFQK